MFLFPAARRAAIREWISRVRFRLTQAWTLPRLMLSFFFMGMLMLNYIILSDKRTPNLLHILRRWLGAII